MATKVPILAGIALTAAVIACSVYANLSLMVTVPANYRYFPPFRPHVNANMNDHLGGEYFNIAQSLYAGEGFAHPFDRRTGPTAWQPPVYPLLLAGLLRVSDGRHAGVVIVVVCLQVVVLIGTGVLVLALVRQTTTRIRASAAAAVFLLGVLGQFWLCFQYTHDGWLVLLTIDLLIAGLFWCRPLERWPRAAAWGLFGGLAAMINPGIGVAWGLLTLSRARRRGAWSRLAVALVVAGLTLAPWTVRNYLVFGRLIPLKSNLFFEMYQTHCLQSDGLLQTSTFQFHPYRGYRLEARAYNLLGETAYLDRKREQFWQAVQADPVEFLDRVASRFLAATLWYVPFQREDENTRPWVIGIARLTHPLPFLAVMVLLTTALWRNLHEIQWAVIGIYVLYLLPYITASYYERYSMPLLAVKVLLVLWAVDRALELVLRRGAPGQLKPQKEVP